MVPAHEVECCAQAYGTQAEIFAGIGHAMMLDVGRQKVAQRVVDRLDRL